MMDSYFTPYAAPPKNPNWNVDLNVKGKTINFAEENAREYLHYIGIDKHFFKKGKKC